MCGIFGYVGPDRAVKISIEGLHKLEYRGYDSAGVAYLSNGELHFCKQKGKVKELEKALPPIVQDGTAIAHTRWATHGEPSTVNAHPVVDESGLLALVHNGIIENHEELRKELKEQGVRFVSETDSEVVVQLIGKRYKGDLLKAVQATLPLLRGAYSLALIHKNHPGEMVIAVKSMPLAIGVGNKESFVSSDTSAFLTHTKTVVFLGDGEVAQVKAGSYTVFDSAQAVVVKEPKVLSYESTAASKGQFDHFMLKEIFEQPRTIRSAMLGRSAEEYGTALLEGLGFDVNELLSVRRILILACGTSYHAGCVAGYMIEEMARIPVQCEISSEFRYKNPIVQEGTLVIAISQSGETADTIAALRELKAKGARVVALCNVEGSTITREASSTIQLRAGPEIGVASTKAFTSQLTVLSLFALFMARMRHVGKSEGQLFLRELESLPSKVQTILDQSARIEQMAKKYASFNDVFFLGRHYMYPTSLEGALKLKEIAYVNANGYPAGEMKHGPIALISPECATIALCANKLTEEKLLSNLMEVKSRRGPILAIIEEGRTAIESITSDVIYIPSTIDALSSITTTVVTQLLAYYIAKARGCEIDQPRNLAKSVTVE